MPRHFSKEKTSIKSRVKKKSSETTIINYKQNKKLILISIALICILTFSAFYPSLKNDFVNWDDDKYVVNNPAIKSIFIQNIKNIFSSIYLANYQPVTMLSYMLDYQIFKLNPAGYHAVNLLFHIVNSILIFWLILIISNNILPAFIAGILFGIHPLHVESVAWIAERKDVLSAFLFLLTIIIYLYYNKSSKIIYYYVAIIVYLLSLLAKPMTVSLPFILILIDYLLNKKVEKKNITNKIPFFVLALLFCVITILTQRSEGAIREQQDFPAIYNFFIACYGILFYIFKSIVPINLSAFYPYPEKMSPLPPIIILFSPIMLFSFIGLIYRFRQNKKLIFGALFYFIAVFPVSQIIPIGQALTAERYSYIPSIGLFYLAGEFLAWLKNVKLRKESYHIIIFNVCIFFILTIFVFITYNRTKVWKNDIVLWTDVLNKFPNSNMALKNLGDAYYVIKDYQKSYEYYNKSLSINSNNSQTYNNVGNILYESKQYDKALEAYFKALQINPDYIDARINVANIYRAKGKFNDALSELNKVIVKQPTNIKCLYMRAEVFESLNEFDKAVSDYSAAINIDQTNTDLLISRGILYHSKASYEKALDDFNKALALKPDSFEGLNGRGLLFTDMRRFEEGLVDFNKVINLFPNEASLYNNRGFLYLNMGKFEEAVNDFNKAISIEPTMIHALQNRALSYLKQKKYNDALRDINKIKSIGGSIDQRIMEELKKYSNEEATK